MDVKQNTLAPEDAARMTRRELHATLSLALIFFLRMFGLFMVYPVFALYAEHLAGATKNLIGLAVGVYGATQVVFQIPFGMLSDRVGRKPVIVAGLLIFATGSIIAALASDITTMIVGRALQGAGAISSAILALVADLTREEQRTKSMAIIGITIGLAFSLAFAAGPVLNLMLGGAGIFWLASALGLTAIAVLKLMVPDPVRSEFHADAEPDPARFGKIIRDPNLLKMDYGVFCLHFIMTATFVVTPVVLRDSAGLIAAEHWKVYVPVMIISVLLLVPMIRLSEKADRLREVFSFAVAIVAIAQLGLGLAAAKMYAIYGFLILFFLGFNFLEASLPSLISRVVPKDLKGTALGVYSTCQFMGIFLGGWVGGWLHGKLGVGAVYLLSAAFAVIWLPLATTMPNLSRRAVAEPYASN